MIINKKKFIAFILAIFVFGTAFGVGGSYLFLRYADNLTLVDRDRYAFADAMAEKYFKLEQLYQKVEQQYYGEYEAEKLMDGIYKGLFRSLDKYSTYLNREEYEAVIEASTGTFAGVGVVISVDNFDQLILLSVIEGSPAERGGLREGDIIVEIDGTKYTGAELDVAAAALRGDVGKKVKVGYLRDGEKKEVTLIRKEIVTTSIVSENIDENIGYIRILSFETGTAKDFEKALHEMETNGTKGVVIDLRANGGGVIDTAIEIADMLLPEGIIITTENKLGENEIYNSDAACTNLPYVILVDGNTASASEILTVAVKENTEGKIVGTKTFGKGVVQQLGGVRGDFGAYKLTVQEYFGPNHTKINGVGIEPDYVVEFGTEEEGYIDFPYLKAVELLGY